MQINSIVSKDQLTVAQCEGEGVKRQGSNVKVKGHVSRSSGAPWRICHELVVPPYGQVTNYKLGQGTSGAI